MFSSYSHSPHLAQGVRCAWWNCKGDTNKHTKERAAYFGNIHYMISNLVKESFAALYSRATTYPWWNAHALDAYGMKMPRLSVYAQPQRSPLRVLPVDSAGLRRIPTNWCRSQGTNLVPSMVNNTHILMQIFTMHQTATHTHYTQHSHTPQWTRIQYIHTNCRQYN